VPPSLSLSAFLSKITYLIATIRIMAQNTIDRTPKTAAPSAASPAASGLARCRPYLGTSNPSLPRRHPLNHMMACSLTPICGASLRGRSRRRLTRRNIPFVFVTGYGRQALPESFGQSPMLTKPFTQEQLLQTAVRLVRTLPPGLGLYKDREPRT
jgi:hypothetical protein